MRMCTHNSNYICGSWTRNLSFQYNGSIYIDMGQKSKSPILYFHIAK